jgi:hypothetical protein
MIDKVYSKVNVNKILLHDTRLRDDSHQVTCPTRETLLIPQSKVQRSTNGYCHNMTMGHIRRHLLHHALDAVVEIERVGHDCVQTH